MTKSKKTLTADGKRFVGCNIPISLFNALEQARGDLGYDNRTEAITEALFQWVSEHPPDSGLSSALANLQSVVNNHIGIDQTLETSVNAYRMSGSLEILEGISEVLDNAPELAQSRYITPKILQDIEDRL